MKKLGLLWLMAAAFMLSLTYTSCDELEGLMDDDKKEEASGEVAFFPKAFADNDIAAWYSYTYKDKDQTKTLAVYLFEDNTFVVTKNQVHNDGRYEREIEASGTYELTEGDYKNGKARVIVMSDDGEAQGVMNVVIEDGKLTTDQEGDEDEVFTKQDNKKVPKASDPASGNINQGGGNNQGDNNQGGEFKAFFPQDCAGKRVSAWYSYSDTIKDEGFEIKYIASIFFFEDRTYVSTLSTSTSGPNINSQEREISQRGTYEFVEGDFSTGSYKIKLIVSASESVIIEVTDGQFKEVDVESGEETIFTIQNSNNVPAPSEPTKDNQGGNNQGGDDQGDSDITAFFPKGYDKANVVAWYSFTDSNPAETRVEAIFLFTDNTFVKTTCKFHSVDDGREPDYEIEAVGNYELVRGNYSDGVATVVFGNGESMEVEIVSDMMFVMEEYFAKQDNADLPAPLKAK